MVEQQRQNHVYSIIESAKKITIPNQRGRITEDPLNVAVTLKKEITPVNGNIDTTNPILQEMFGQSHLLRSLPQRECPRELLTILRSRVGYSFPHVLTDLEKKDPHFVQAIRENNALPFIDVRTIEQAVRLGYANCNALAISMLILGKEAGLEGAYVTNGPYRGFGKGEDPNPIRNITRKDTNQSLFTCYPHNGQNIPEGHAWVEFRTDEGEWIPVDPATQLVGDTEEGLEIFREAQYHASVDLATAWHPQASKVKHNGVRDLEFFPGEAQHTGVLQIYTDIEAKNDDRSMTLALSKPELLPNLVIGVNFSIAEVSA